MICKPSSSPDELSAHVAGHEDRGKRPVSDVKDKDELAHDPWNSDNIGYSRETYVPRPSRRRSGADNESATGTQAEAGHSTAKRKRQKKEDQEETALEDAWDSDKIGFPPRERYAPRPSRRRFRTVVQDDEDVQHPGQSMPDTCPPDDVNNEVAEDTGPNLISSGQQLPQKTMEDMDDMEGVEGVDPDVWAALPDDIRQELKAQHAPQTSRARRSGRFGEVSGSPKAVQEGTPQPKKRGRKKKEQNMNDARVGIEEPVVAFEEPEAPAPTATAKRKRGRPKKSELVQLPPAFEDDEGSLVTEVPERVPETIEDASATHDLADEASHDVVEAPKPLKAPAKRGRKKKVPEVPPVQKEGTEASVRGDEEEAVQGKGMGEVSPEPSPSRVDPTALSVEAEDRQALRDISNTASNNSTSGKADETKDAATDKVEKQQEVTPEPKPKEVTKSASTPGQQGTAPLRVGLSKKSRIPSLLKVIRK